MQINIIVKFSRVLLVLAILCGSASLLLAAPLNLPLNVTRSWNANGTTEFSIDVLNFSPPILVPTPTPHFEPSIKLTAPDGTVNIVPNFLIKVSGLSFSELQSRFIGTWTIQELGPSGAISQFSLLPFTESSFFNEQPSIVSPHEGDVLPPTFDIDWSYPSGTYPNGRTVSYVGSGQSSLSGNFASSPPRFPRFTLTDSFTKFDGTPVTPPELLTLRAGSYDPLTPFLTPVVPVSGVSPNTYSLTSGGYRNLSAPIVVTVIPEPSSVILVALGIACVGMRRLLRRNQFVRRNTY